MESPVDPVDSQDELMKIVNDEGAIEKVADVEKLLALFQSEEEIEGRAALLLVLQKTTSVHCLQRFVVEGGLKVLSRWLKEADSEDGQELMELTLEVLPRLPVTVETVTSSQIARRLKKLRKRPHPNIKSRAVNAINTWKEDLERQEEEAAKATKKRKRQENETEGRVHPGLTPVDTLDVKNSTNLPMGGLAEPRVAEKAVVTKPHSDEETKKTVERSNMGAVKAPEYCDGAKIDTIAQSDKRNLTSNDPQSAEVKKKTGDVADISAREIAQPPALPKIESFGSRGPEVETRADGKQIRKRRLRWADEEGKELELIKVFKSFEAEQTQSENDAAQSFKEAQKHEHELERSFLLKERENAKEALRRKMSAMKPVVQWKAPPKVKLPGEFQELSVEPLLDVKEQEMTLQDLRNRTFMPVFYYNSSDIPISPSEAQTRLCSDGGQNLVYIPTDVEGTTEPNPQGQSSALPNAEVSFTSESVPGAFGTNSSATGAAPLVTPAVLPDVIKNLDPPVLAALLQNVDLATKVIQDAIQGRPLNIEPLMREAQKRVSTGPAYQSLAPLSIRTSSQYADSTTQSTPLQLNAQSSRSPRMSHLSSRDSGSEGRTRRERTPDRYPKRKATPQCRFYKSSRGCKAGQDCKFLHD